MRYYIGFLIAIGLSIILILLLFARGGNSPKHIPVVKPLNSYAATDAVVSETVDGPINADSLHQSYEISISNTSATYQQFTGYNRTLVSSKSYANNENAYYAFLTALGFDNFTLGSKNPALSNDTAHCAAGSRTDYELTENGETLEHFWTDTCGGGTYEGLVGPTAALFENQIPDYSTLTSKINF